ncbi:MAG: (d)CMP kinase [Candidatus Cloacimonadaceae bacterium]|jgi:cytidylate kinase|nr:(d)CMP kinase [Candidatus Cloacimonadota bacterium]MDY0127957.1 (d)CMP kinase [Candidatus Cloacimonadaceae bacterium]MCB5254123.1 (d)CMP kinase [Candidatus Cloacimonadota bacterium]MCK9178577.1 (d)CMP kinase [Candidatus Cloacimonadota bacterium]MCK9242400.1 (d)CMP kinase [Candidatus Cloacimonadota bacterium]
MKRIIIAIDGPAASGKSTTAKLLARKLRYLYLDTGAMYRACALAAKRQNIDIDDSEALKGLMDSIQIKIQYSELGNITLLDSEDVSLAIREPEISLLASAISAKAVVRTKMVELQREMGKAGGVILDGRDIGTVVFPEAELKIFLVAPVQIRAQRRFLELQDKGLNPIFEEVLSELKERDLADSSRALAPLIPARDAIEIDTGQLSIEGQVAKLYQYYQKRMAGL